MILNIPANNYHNIVTKQSYKYIRWLSLTCYVNIFIATIFYFVETRTVIFVILFFSHAKYLPRINNYLSRTFVKSMVFSCILIISQSFIVKPWHITDSSFYQTTTFHRSRVVWKMPLKGQLVSIKKWNWISKGYIWMIYKLHYRHKLITWFWNNFAFL